MSRTSAVLVLAAALFIGAGPYIVRAAGVRQAPAGGIANVSMARLVAESDARRTVGQNVQKFASTVAQRYDEISKLQYLTTDEIEEYTAALNAQAPTDAQKQRLAALKAESAKRVEEQQQLSTKKDADLTQQDRARLRQLAGLEQERPSAMEALKRYYQNLVTDEQARQMRDAEAQVRDIVAKLAREQGITQVFDTSSMVVAPVDLTQQALARVKKR